jgi:polysaccharide biosynthesis/export protein
MLTTLKRERNGSKNMKSTWLSALGALILISNLAMAQDPPTQPAESSAPTSAAPGNSVPAITTNAVANNQAGPTYVIGPDDTLHIAVWKEADFTATVPVRPDGKISLPLLNDVQAAGLTPQQLADSITQKLKKYVDDPRVTVVVAAINSKRVYMVGEVARSGALSMLPNMTVLQALSSAGLNQFAKTKGIYILRIENGKQEKLPVNYRKLVKGQRMEQNYLLQPGDTIVVP